MVAPENIELEASIEFWAGRKLEIDLTKVDNGKLANVLKDIQFDVTISGDDKAFIQLPDGTKATSTTLTTDSNGESKLTIITTKENITVTFTERDNKFYIDNGPIEIDFTFNTASKTWNASIKNETSLRDVVDVYKRQVESIPKSWITTSFLVSSIELYSLKDNNPLASVSILGILYFVPTGGKS